MIFLRRLFSTRPRLTLASAAGLVMLLLPPVQASLLTHILLAWNMTAWLYLISLWVLMMRANPERIRRIARMQDESAAKVLVLVCVASVMSLIAILLEMATARQLGSAARALHLGLTGLTLGGAWLLVPTAFAIHYAHLFYLGRPEEPVLLFPDKPNEPSYWDFLYFSFTLAVASQTADVAVGNARARKLVLAQSVLSFVFNISILGLAINVMAGLLG